MMKIGVVGAGQMGKGIAQVAAIAGYDVNLYDLDEIQLDKACEDVRKSVFKLVEKGLLSHEMAEKGFDRIKTTTMLTDFCDCNFVIEAVPEIQLIKEDILIKLDQIIMKDAILASNTSSISITKLASVTSRADRVIGVHFMNPVPVMKLVEIIRSLTTSDETYKNTVEFVKNIGKESVLVKDYPGFIVNRVLIPMINEAIFALFEGVGSAEDIDKAMVYGTNQPMGPLSLADLIGLDTVLAIMEVLCRGYSDSKYRPCPLLVRMVEAGFLGRKAGKGFYTYK